MFYEFPQKVVLLTNDVETTSIWFNTLKDETGELAVEQGLPILLDLYSKYDIKATFFYTAHIAKLFPEAVNMVCNNGHEIASHGKSHKKEFGFDIMSYAEQKSHLEYSKKLLEDISGKEVVSFRAPSLRVNNNTVKALSETGFQYDSSIASQRFDFFMSLGSIKKLNWLRAPRLPYRISNNNIFKKGQSSLIEIPISALIVPYIGTTMRIFPNLTKILRLLLHYENIINHKPIVFDIHPNEFINEGEGERSIERRNDNIIKFILQDLIRSKLKVRNSGEKAIPLYENVIKFYYNRGYNFMTVKDYGDKIKFVL